MMDWEYLKDSLIELMGILFLLSVIVIMLSFAAYIALSIYSSF